MLGHPPKCLAIFSQSYVYNELEYIGWSRVAEWGSMSWNYEKIIVLSRCKASGVAVLLSPMILRGGGGAASRNSEWLQMKIARP